MTTLDLIRELAVALGGICVGFVIGRWERRVNADRPSRERWFEIARLALGLLILAAVGVTVWQVQSVSACQAKFATQVAQAIADRSEANGASTQLDDAANRSLATLVDAILSPQRDDDLAALQDFRAAIDRQHDALADLERVRLAAPLPAPPRC